MAENLLFSNHLETVAVRDLSFQLHIISDLDEALDHYIKVSPSDTDKIPYFTRLWESARVLADFLVGNPQLVSGKRFLEVGCGLGLPTLCAAKLGARATASDFHPDNRAFFLNNAEINQLSGIEYRQMDWRQPDPQEPYDIIVGSDLIYEKQMVEPLTTCVPKLLKDDGLFLLADPGRTALQTAVSAMEKQGFHWRLITDKDIWLFVFTRNSEFPSATDGEKTFP